MHANVHTQTRNKILRFWKFYQNMASTYFAVTEPRSQYIWVCIKYFGGCLSNVRWGVTATFTFLSLGHKRMVFTPVFAASMVDGCGRAGAGLPLAAARWLCVYWALYPAVLVLGWCWLHMKAKHDKKLPGHSGQHPAARPGRTTALLHLSSARRDGSYFYQQRLNVQLNYIFITYFIKIFSKKS